MGLRIEKPSDPGKPSDAHGPSDRSRTADYIGGMAAELRGIATKAELDFLAYLLSMVEDEARSIRS